MNVWSVAKFTTVSYSVRGLRIPDVFRRSSYVSRLRDFNSNIRIFFILKSFFLFFIIYYIFFNLILLIWITPAILNNYLRAFVLAIDKFDLLILSVIFFFVNSIQFLNISSSARVENSSHGFYYIRIKTYLSFNET